SFAPTTSRQSLSHHLEVDVWAATSSTDKNRIGVANPSWNRDEPFDPVVLIQLIFRDVEAVEVVSEPDLLAQASHCGGSEVARRVDTDEFHVLGFIFEFMYVLEDED